MRRTIGEAHQHLARNHPVRYCLLGLALAGAVTLAALGFYRSALAVFVVAGLAGLTMFRYQA